MNGENSLPGWLRQILIGIALFFAGAILAFGYSYRPLHGALTWKIDRLETRLDERNRENVRLRDTLARQKAIEEKKVDPETLAQVERELEETKRVLTRTERDLKRAEKKRKAALASATRWRKRFEELRDAPAPTPSPEPVALAPAPPGPASNPSGPATVGAASEPSTIAPAAPAASDPDRPASASAATAPSPPPQGRGILLPTEVDVEAGRGPR